MKTISISLKESTMNHLTCIERIIIESLQRKKKNAIQLHQDTGLETRLIINVLNALTIRGFVQQQDRIYSVKEMLHPENKKLLNSTESIKHEAMEIIESMLMKGESIKLKKVYVTAKDLPILRALINNLNNFFLTLPQPESDIEIKDYSLFVWGLDNYSNTINNLIKG
jgi:hypothetical protein